MLLHNLACAMLQLLRADLQKKKENLLDLSLRIACKSYENVFAFSVAAHRPETGVRALRTTTNALLSLLAVRGNRSDKMGHCANKMKTNRGMCFVE
jgi:hypothetical protein